MRHIDSIQQEEVKLSNLHITLFIIVVLSAFFYHSTKVTTDGNVFRMVIYGIATLFVITFFGLYSKTEKVKNAVIVFSSLYFYVFFLLYPETASGYLLVAFIPTIPIMFFEKKMFYMVLTTNIIFEHGLVLLGFLHHPLLPPYLLQYDPIANYLIFMGIQAMISLIFMLNLRRMQVVQKFQEQKIEYLAYYDQLTSLPNRVLFQRTLQEMMKQSQAHQKGLGMMILDLDNFKKVNDTLGHPIGDELLIHFARKIEESLPKGKGFAARMGGDEFTVLLNDMASEDIKKVAQQIIWSLQKPLPINGVDIIQHFKVTTSIGISVYPLDGDDPETLFQHADMAMYASKRNGKNTFTFFTPALKEEQEQIVESN